MTVPSATYRIQLNKDFTFSNLLELIDYLHKLGISTIYASPILKATPGSLHGYDVTDPGAINPEIGTESDFNRVIDRVKELGMTWLQDIVPNHMAFHPHNFRLMDILERGPSSEYYNYFDIDWNHPDPDLNGKLMVPFLGKPLAEAIAGNEIRIDINDNGFVVSYFSSCYPLSVSALTMLASHTQTLAEELVEIAHAGSVQMRYDEWQEVKRRAIRKLFDNESKYGSLVDLLDRVNRDRSLLDAISRQQFYSLTYWKDTESKINYRRFFTVNELICLRMEDPQVFDDYHRFVFHIAKNSLQGIRIDHIDGLNQPAGYMRSLRTRFGDHCYIIAEKILESKEEIPTDWAIQGTSGYEFLAYLNQLMTNKKGAKLLRNFYKEVVPDQPAYADLVLENKMMILKKYMAGEWDNLTHLFVDLGIDASISFEEARKAIGALLVCLPVYRIYPEQLPLEGRDLSLMKETFHRASTKFPEVAMGIDFLRRTLLEERSDHGARLKFLQRLMQYSGPLTAKGVEDTTFYNYNALLSHDEVGDSPATLGISITQFHQRMLKRQLATPLSLNTTSTHDTKRGEDARIRLNALCDLAEEWTTLAANWIDANRTFRQRTSKGILAPLINDEYFIYQSIVAGIPPDLEVTSAFLERLENYLRKVLREAKQQSDWANPDVEYEDACVRFIRQITFAETEFMKTLVPFMAKVQQIANRYSIAQALLKVVSPGIPDTYRGCELWDLSYVDPDNRRPVDYSLRKNHLEKLMELDTKGISAVWKYAQENEGEGVGKLYTLWKTLNFRRDNAVLFSEAEYLPLQVAGKDSVTLAFARVWRDKWVIVVVPLKFNGVLADSTDEIVLPPSAPKKWKNIFDGEELLTDGRLSISSVVATLPVAMMVSI